MIVYKKIDEAFDFYNIDNKYKKMCYDCAEEINNSCIYTEAFDRVYKKIYYNDFKDIRKLWDIKSLDRLFANNINPFVTNVIILLGYEIHIHNIKKYNLDKQQINIHKKRVKECFENDIVNRGYKGIRISQMLWAIYFIRLRIIEVGVLQYEYYNVSTVKIHIPKQNKLDISSVKKSIFISKSILENIFHIKNIIYVCNSWLLSNQVYEIIDKNCNISKFHDLFNVEDGENCISDILNFVYEVNICDNFNLLQENTSLQRIIKKELINDKKFYLGNGLLNLKYMEDSNE